MKLQQLRSRLRPQLVWLSALFLLTLGVSPAFAQDSGKSYTRFVKNDQKKVGKLQIAQAVFKKPGEDTEVVLYGVIHIADKRYYRAVQKDLDTYETVLWEGVKPGRGKGGIASVLGQSINTRKFIIEILDLELQGRHINTRKPNFVWADVDMDTINEEFRKAMPDLPEYNLKIMKMVYQLIDLGLKYGSPYITKFLNDFPEIRHQIKMGMAEGMKGDGLGNAGIMKALDTVILGKRNEAVMKVFDREIAKKPKSLAIFYGAAHMPDFEMRLKKMGYKRVSKEWKSAWTIRAPRQGAAMEKMMEKRMKRGMKRMKKGSKRDSRARLKKRGVRRPKAQKRRNPKAKLY